MSYPELKPSYIDKLFAIHGPESQFFDTMFPPNPTRALLYAGIGYALMRYNQGSRGARAMAIPFYIGATMCIYNYIFASPSSVEPDAGKGALV